MTTYVFKRTKKPEKWTWEAYDSKHLFKNSNLVAKAGINYDTLNDAISNAHVYGPSGGIIKMQKPKEIR